MAGEGSTPPGKNMPETVERRTVTRTTRIEGASDIKNNLAQVAAEIARVRDRARDEVQSLDKIRGMLDVGYLTSLIKSIEELEVRMHSLEEAAVGSAAEVDRVNGELRREQERLAKLWDAYKAQEDELNRLKRDAPLLQERLLDRERQVESLRRDVARLEPLSRYKAEYDAVVRENQVLRVEVDNLNREVRRLSDDMRRREDELVRLREDAVSKSRVQEVERLLEEERERLAKLYKVYEEQEAAHKDAQARLAGWEEWFRRIEPSMTLLCRSAADAPRA
jgi:chromosome segregation ATPase